MLGTFCGTTISDKLCAFAMKHDLHVNKTNRKYRISLWHLKILYVNRTSVHICEIECSTHCTLLQQLFTSKSGAESYIYGVLITSSICLRRLISACVQNVLNTHVHYACFESCALRSDQSIWMRRLEVVTSTEGGYVFSSIFVCLSVG